VTPPTTRACPTCELGGANGGCADKWHLKPSVRATYDSAETGMRYHVTTSIDGRTDMFRWPVPDPFARTTVHVGWRDLLRGLLRRRLAVEVIVSADTELMNDVLELDDQTLTRGRTRQAAFQQAMHQKLRAMTTEEDRWAP